MLKKSIMSIVAVGLVAGAMTFMGCDDDDDDGTGPVDPCANATALELRTPTAGEDLKVGTPYTISWCVPADMSVIDVGIDFSADAGENYTEIGGGSITHPTVSYVWTPTIDDVGADCLIMIYEYGNKATFDLSGSFTVSQ